MDIDDDVSFFTRKPSTIRTGQGRPLVPTISRKHVQSVPSAGPSSAAIKNKPKRRRVLSSSSSASEHHSPIEDLAGTSESDMEQPLSEKQRKKRALKELTTSRSSKQNKPRSISPVVPPPPRSKKGKERAVELDDDEEIDELASQPASLSRSAAIDLSSEPDYDLPPPLPAAKAPTQSWKPRARPKGQPSATQANDIPDSPPPTNGPPPIRSDGTFSSSASPAFHSRSRSPRSQSLDNAGDTSFINEFARYPAYEDDDEFYIPPPLARATKVPSYASQVGETRVEDRERTEGVQEPMFGGYEEAENLGEYEQHDFDSGAGGLDLQGPEQFRRMRDIEVATGSRDSAPACSAKAKDGTSGVLNQPPSSISKHSKAASSQQEAVPSRGSAVEQQEHGQSSKFYIDVPAKSSEGDAKTSKFFPERKKPRTEETKKQGSQASGTIENDDQTPLACGESKQRKGEYETEAGGGQAGRQEEEAVKKRDVKGKGRAYEAAQTPDAKAGRQSLSSSRKRGFQYQEPDNLVSPAARSNTVKKSNASGSNSRAKGDEVDAGGKGKRKAVEQSSPVKQDAGSSQRKRRRILQSEEIEDEATEACLVCEEIFPASLIQVHQAACIEEHASSGHQNNTATHASKSALPARKPVESVQQASDRRINQSNQPFRPTNPPANPVIDLAKSLFPDSSPRNRQSKQLKRARAEPEADDEDEEIYQEMMRQEAGPSCLPATKPITRSGKKAIQAQNKQNANAIIELDDDDEDDEADSEIEQVQTAVAEPSRIAQPVQRADKGKGRARSESPPIGSIFISKLPKEIKQGYYHLLGLNERGELLAEEPDSEEEARPRPAKGAPLQGRWKNLVGQEKEGRSKAGGSRKTWRKPASKKRFPAKRRPAKRK